MRSTKHAWCVGLLSMGLVGCGGGGSDGTVVVQPASGSEQAATESPETLDANYREAARHMVSSPVFDGPMTGLAGDALSTLRAYSQGRGNPEQYLSLEIVSADWLVSRNRATGVVTGRHVDAIAIAAFPDGRCLMYASSFIQEAVGDEFSDSLSTQGTGGGFPVPCATVDAIAAARSTVAR